MRQFSRNGDEEFLEKLVALNHERAFVDRTGGINPDLTIGVDVTGAFAASIAGSVRKTRNLEETISNVLDSLYRLGHVSSKDGKSFEIRRVA